MKGGARDGKINFVSAICLALIEFGLPAVFALIAWVEGGDFLGGLLHFLVCRVGVDVAGRRTPFFLVR